MFSDLIAQLGQGTGVLVAGIAADMLVQIFHSVLQIINEHKH